MPLIGTNMSNYTFLARFRYTAAEPQNLNFILISLNHPSVTIFINCVYTL